MKMIKQGEFDSTIVAASSILCCLLFYSQNLTFEADGVSRIIIAESWLKAPHFIFSDIWPPLHTYLIALATLILGDREWPALTVSLLSISVTSACIFNICKTINSRGAAFIATTCWILNPVALRLGTDIVSEPLFVALIAASILQLSIFSLAPRSYAPLVTAGLMMTLASAVRYESWILIPIASFFLALKSWRFGACFLFFASIFPVSWLAGGVMEHGDPLFGIHGNTAWVTNADKLAAGGDLRTIISKATFLPGAFFIGLMALPLVMLIMSIVPALKKGGFPMCMAMALITMVAVFWYQQVFGYLLPRPRYMLVLFMMSIVLVGCVLKTPRRIRLTQPPLLLAGFALVCGFLILNLLIGKIPNGVGKTFSRFSPQHELPSSTSSVLAEISRTIESQDVLVIDFMNWEERTVALRTTASNQATIFLPGAPGEKLDESGLIAHLCRAGRGLFVLRRESNFYKAHAKSNNTMEWAGLQIQSGKVADVADFEIFRAHLDSTQDPCRRNIQSQARRIEAAAS
jgi:hypothetical protein